MATDANEKILIVNGNCPTEGRVTLTRSDQQVTTVHFPDTGGVEVRNPDGTIQDFATCAEAETCR